MDISDALTIAKTLADGIDPFTGEVLEESNVYQHPQTVRALYTLIQSVEVKETPPTKHSAKAQRQGEAWTEEEDNKLIALFQKNVPIPALAGKHKRSSGAIKSRLKRLGLIEDDNE